MVTIDKFDMGIHIQYARRTQLVEQISQQYHLDRASSIPAQLRVYDFSPRPLEIDILLGSRIVQNPLAYFLPPPRFRYQRRSPFGFFRVAPSLGSFYDEEGEDETERQLDEIQCSGTEEEKEKQMIKSCLEQISKINGWIGFIIGRVGQFLQG